MRFQNLYPKKFLIFAVSVWFAGCGGGGGGGGGGDSTPPVNETATFTINAIIDATVVENSTYTSVTPEITGTPIGALTYSLGGVDAGDFTIDSSTGVVSMVAQDYEVPVDANTDNFYEVTVTATDTNANVATQSWTVEVTLDTTVDADGDGWRIMDNDCSDDPVANTNAALINPGAYEIVGNGADDDCDVTTSDITPPSACSSVAKFGSITALDLTESMELCQTTLEAEPIESRKWGVIDAELVIADGAVPNASQFSDISDSQTAVLTDYGTGGIAPISGPTMVGISTGKMRDKGDPGYAAPNTGTSHSWLGNPPADYLAVNGGSLPSSLSCAGACPAGSGANDSVNLKLRIRVPTNANGFSFNFRFFSAEYWTYTCTTFNDYFLALLTTGAGGIPADKNISFDSQNNPVSVNNGLFEVCVAKGCYTCPSGSGELAGTGMEDGSTGGGTNWLKTSAPVLPGEIITLEFILFDVGDNILDSNILLDNFQWIETTTGTGTSGG